MAFTNRLGKLSIGFGNPISNDALFLSQGNSLSGTTAQTTTLSNFVPAIQAGRIRLKVYNGGGTSPTLANVAIQVTDGTTTETVWSFNPASAPSLGTGSQVTLTSEFLSELAVTSVKVITTLGGTSPTASLDVEVSATN